MSKSRRPQDVVRRPKIESCEVRSMMTAASLYDFHLDYTVEQQPLQTFEIDAYGSLSQLAFSATAAAHGFTGAGQTVAVIDSGIAYDHAALGGGFGSSYRVVGGWDFTEENDANPYDDGPAGSHGTHVAGIIGSTDATRTGVAAGVDLVALRVFNDQGNGSFSWVENALRWVHIHRNDFENPITTVNLSLGATWNSDSIPSWAMLEDEFAQLEADGIFISVAAGNSFTSYNAAGLSYPAASSYVVPVSSVDASGNLSSFSQRNDRVIAAPGRAIRSTVPDYVGNVNGRTDDFASYSGTSMAAPFVAGASVLIRQAMESVGRLNINQDAIYDVMRETADLVYDAITNHSYTRLNLERAISSVLSTDDFGSTAGAAHNLGTVTSTTVSGAIGQSDDRDYFRFVAGQSGVAHFTVTPGGGWQADWDLVGGGGAVSGNVLSFNVTAGASYTVGLASLSGTGSFSLGVNIERVVADLGAIDFALFDNQNLAAGDAWYSVTASRSGTFTTELLFSHAAGNVDLEVFNSAQQLVGSSAGRVGTERVDVAANAGDVFLIHVRGANADVDLRLTNLVSRVGSTANVAGTSGDDTFVFQAGTTHRVTINGVVYQFAGSSARTVAFAGGGGQDTATLTGTSANETATLRPGSVELAGSKYRVTADSAESITVNAGSGTDRAILYDSTGNDVFTATPASATLVGAGYSNRVSGFDRVEALASEGIDLATLFDSTGNDTFLASPTSAALYGRLFYNGAQGFDSVEANSTAGGTDKALFSDSAQDDIFIANPALAIMYNSSYFNSAAGFERVQAQATQGGNDIARLYDSAGNDTLSARGRVATMAGAGYQNQVEGFDRVVAQGTTGANTLRRGAVDFVFDWMGNWS